MLKLNLLTERRVKLPQFISYAKKSKFLDNAKQFLKSKLFENFVAKTIIFLVIWAIALIPVWIATGMWSLLEPVTFWQMLAFVVVACITMGWLQVIAFIFAFILTVGIISENL